jgi:hypothetical protein
VPVSYQKRTLLENLSLLSRTTEIFITYRNKKTFEHVGRKGCLRSLYGGVETQTYSQRGHWMEVSDHYHASTAVESNWNVMAHSDARDWKWRGNWRVGCVASTLHTASEHGVSSITTADAHTSAASSRLNWRPHSFKWARPFRRKTKSGFCACAITFQMQSATGKELLSAHSTEGSAGLRTDLNKEATPFQVIQTRSFSQYPGPYVSLGCFAFYSRFWAGNSQARFWVDVILPNLSLQNKAIIRQFILLFTLHREPG